MPVLDFDLFGGVVWCAQPNGDVVGNLLAAGGQNHRVPDAAFNKNGDVGSAAANIHQHHAHFALNVGEYGLAGGQRLQHQRVDLHIGLLHALDQVAD